MQYITIFSLGNSRYSLMELIEKSIFSKMVCYNSDNEIQINFGKNQLINLKFLRDDSNDFFSLKHKILVNFENLTAKDDFIKFKLVKYIKESKFIVNIFCEDGFSQETFAIIPNLAKLFRGIIFVNGTIINSDTKIILDLKGNSETDDFIGDTNFFPMNMQKNESYLDVLDSLSVKIDITLPGVKKLQNIKIRSKEELIKRALALVFLGSYAEGLLKTDDLNSVRNFLFAQSRKYDIVGTYSEKELNFIFNNNPTENQLKNYANSFDYAHLFWHLLSFSENFVFPPRAVYPHELLIISSKYLNFNEILEASLLKNEEFIINNYDLNYRLLNFLETNDDFNGNEFNLELLRIRDKAFKWTTSYKDLNWDKI